MKLVFIIFLFNFFSFVAHSQPADSLTSFNMYGDVIITMDIPVNYNRDKKTLLILYALPNGNSTAQTMGKKMKIGDDWHFNIQNIKAQTGFIRDELKNTNIVVAYLENNYKSWPSWKTKHQDYTSEVQHIVDTLYNMYPEKLTTFVSTVTVVAEDLFLAI